MPKVTGLVRQGGRYSFRRGVPEALRTAIGKREVWITLGTSDHAVAVRKAREAAVATDGLFERARSALRTGEPFSPADAQAFSDDELQRVSQRALWRREKEAGRSLAVPAGYDRAGWEQEVEEELAAFETEDPSALAQLAIRAQHVAKIEGMELAFPAPGEKPQPALSRFIELLRRVEIEGLRRDLDRLGGGHGDAAHDPLFAGISSLSGPAEVAAVKPITLGEAIDRFETDPTRKHLRGTGKGKYAVTFRAMREVIANDRPLAAITRAECAAVQGVFAGLPANFQKLKPYKGLKKLGDVVSAAKTRSDRMMSPGTVRTYSHELSSLFNWAVKKGLVSTNPATRMAPARGPAEISRRPFSVDELNKLVASLPAWSDARALAGRFWVPLIALFSGMRLGEIVTLHTNDVTMADGVQAFVLRRDGEKRLKTAGAERVIPVHPELARLGLLEHVAAMRAEGEARLFPDLPGDTQRHIGSVFQKRFAYHQKKVLGISEAGVCFHSFRHGFRDALREGGVPIDATRALGGWARSGGVEERYGQGTRPATLARWMAEVRFPGLSLASLALTPEQ